jgi:hypothetical protein
VPEVFEIGMERRAHEAQLVVGQLNRVHVP